MATFQLSGLPNLQIANSNAPQASDANTALAFIRQNNEDQRQGANNLGLQALQAVKDITQTHQQFQQQQKQAAFQKKMGEAFSASDINGMRKLAADYPEQMQAIQQGMGFVDANKNQAIGSAAMALKLAAGQGPEAVKGVLMKNADALGHVGINPEDAWQTYQQDPQQFNRYTDLIGLHALGPEKYFDVMDKQQGRDIQRGQLAETQRSNDMSNARGWANVGIAQQGVNLRKLELQDKALERQISRETNQVQLGVLQDKRAATQRELEQAKTDKVDAYNSGMDTMTRTIDTANKVLNSPGFTGYFGTNLNPLSSRFIPGTDAADTSALVDTLGSQGFMSGIQQMRGLGALSNAEGQKVMDAIGNLSANQSEKSARAAIKTIINTTQMAQKRMQQKYGQDIPAPQPEQSLSDDELVNKYLGGR